MIKFYTNQELSQKFKIKLARWKRWSREFLPPDPLGGLQSGYARQYNPDEAFTVFLGGNLVGDLKFSIPEARQIMHDLQSWLVDRGFYYNFSGTSLSENRTKFIIQHYQIAIYRPTIGDNNDSAFFYLTKGLIAQESIKLHAAPVRQERFIESSINPAKRESPVNAAASHQVLNISNLRHRFLRLLEDG